MDGSLCLPVYFFLKHLSFLDLCYVSVTVPRFICDLTMHSSNIPLWECISQCCAFRLCGSAEMAMLTVMPYDRCVAICLPSSVLWNRHECQHLYSWNLSHLDQWGHLWRYTYICCFPHHFYGASIIYKLFCDISQLLKLTCSNEYVSELGVTGFLFLMAFFCFISIWFTHSHTHTHTHTHILCCVEDPICWGQSKGLFHLPPPPAIIILFSLLVSFEFLKPHTDSPTALDFTWKWKSFSQVWLFVTPWTNAVIGVL